MKMSPEIYYDRLLLRADIEKSWALIEQETINDSTSIYERIFLWCAEEIIIFSNEMKQEVFDKIKIQDAAIKYLKQENVLLNIILHSQTEEDYDKVKKSAFVQSVIADLRPTWKLKINLLWKENIKKDKEVVLGDQRIIKEREWYRWTVCFNDEKMVKKQRDYIATILEENPSNYEFNI